MKSKFYRDHKQITTWDLIKFYLNGYDTNLKAKRLFSNYFALTFIVIVINLLVLYGFTKCIIIDIIPKKRIIYVEPYSGDFKDDN